MTSPASIDAGRRDAEKLTGPRTVEREDRSRLNALGHEMDAKTAVLPHEDAAREGERAHRCQARRGRALLQTLKAIATLRPALATPVEDQPESTAPPEQSQRIDDKNRHNQDLRRGEAPRSRPGPAVVPLSATAPLMARRPLDHREPVAAVRAPAG
ncbi:MAG: hypothetical protein U0790_21935 [Isosphaeraceae bacterium]